MLRSVYRRLRYGEFREVLPDLHVGKWFVYHRGSLAVARRGNREIDLIGRLTYGLSLSGACVLMQWRNPEGTFEYGLQPIRKIKDEDLTEAMTLNPPPSREQREYMERDDG